MTISSEETVAGPYTSSGSAGPYSFPFYAQSQNDISVFLDGVETSAFSVSFNSGNNGGSITLDSAPGVGVEILIALDFEALQSTVFANAAFSSAQASALQTAIDRLTQNHLQLKRGAIRLPVSVLSDDSNLETSEPAALAYLRMDALNSGVEWVDGNGSPVSPGDTPSQAVVVASGTTEGRTLATRFADVLNLLDFAPTGDGVADDTAEVQAWINAMRDQRKAGYAPEGDYLCDALTFASLAQEFTPCIRGAGPNLTRFIKKTNDANPLITFSESSATVYLAGIVIEGIAFEGLSGAPCVRTYSMVRGGFRDCEMTGGSIGVEQNGGIGVFYEGCGIHGNATGIKIQKYSASVGDGYPNLTAIRSGYITENTAVGVDFNHGVVLNIENCDIEDNGTTATANNGNILVGALIGEAISAEGLGVVMHGGWLEAADGDAAAICKSGLNIFRDVMTVANTSTYDFKFDGGRYILEGIESPTGHTTSVIEDAACGAPNFIIACAFNGALSISTDTIVLGAGGAHLRLPHGSASNPSYSFAGLTTAGWYALAGTPNSVRLAIDGALHLNIYPAAFDLVTDAAQFLGPNCGASAPTFSFRNDVNTGMYWVGADQIGWATGGTNRMTLADASLTLASGVALTVNGAFTSLGIDDNATGERLQIADSDLTYGASGVAYVFKHAAADQSIRFAGGNAFNNGSNFILYGGSHASKANDVEILAGTSQWFTYDNSANSLTITSTAVVVGAPTGGAGNGAGTINAVGVYDDNVLLTDYVFDQFEDGAVKDADAPAAAAIGFDPQWLDRAYVTAFWKRERRLPWMPSREAFEKSKPSVGDLLNRLWAGQEIMATWLAS
jgi:hypothetical protein